MPSARILVPIVRLGGELKETAVADGRLGLLLPREKQEWAEAFTLDTGALSKDVVWPIKAAQYALRFVGEAAVGSEPSSLGEARRVGDNLVTALRMVGDGAPTVAYAYELSDTPGSRTYQSHMEHYPLETGDWLVSNDGMVQDAIRLALDLENAKEVLPGFDVMRERFDHSYDRVAARDQFVDWAIALEACLGQGVKTRIGERIAARAATLLDDEAARTRAIAVIPRIYAVRNALVHGSLAGSLWDLPSYKELTPFGPQRFPFSQHGDPNAAAQAVVRQVLSAVIRRAAKDGSFSPTTL
jgi:hypothetical protein